MPQAARDVMTQRDRRSQHPEPVLRTTLQRSRSLPFVDFLG
jgi:hypothetical protein